MNILQIVWTVVGALSLVGGPLLVVRYSLPGGTTWKEAWSDTAGLFTIWIIISSLVAGYVMGILWLGQWQQVTTL